MEDYSPSLTDIDGVPVASAPLDPIATATLIFTVGSRDETPRTAGVAHLIEHLVMRRVGRVTAPHNAMTDADSIRFFVSGTDVEIADFLERVASAISWLPSSTEEDIAPERRTIGAELGPAGEEGRIGPLFIRFGLHDLGLADFGQPTYRTLPIAAVHDFARRYLHRGNAAVTITGPVPTGVRLPLPEGERRPDRRPPETLRSDLPAWCGTPVAPVTVSFEVRGNPALQLATIAGLSACLERVLRHENNLVYSAVGSTFSLDRDRDLFVFVLDPDRDSAPEAFEAAVLELHRVASSGLDRRDLEHAMAVFRSGAGRHASRIAWLEALAVAEARGRRDELGTFADTESSVLAVTTEDVGRVVADGLGTMLVTISVDLDPMIPERLLLPPTNNPPRIVPPGITNRSRPVSRRDWAVLAPRRGRGLSGYQLLLSELGIAELGPGGAFEAPLADVATVGRRRDGSLNLALVSGRVFYVQPADWKDPRGWIPRLLSMIPDELFYERAD